VGRADGDDGKVFAEWERAIIRKRVIAGIARARTTGTKTAKPIGRTKISPAKEKAILDALAAGRLQWVSEGP
jgi:DNA invertase Pin-like site-specific DNA recombinase